jgi:Thiopurine S-methyltransferase (TPMT)
MMISTTCPPQRKLDPLAETVACVESALNSNRYAAPSWNDSYASGVPPWDTGQPEPLLIEFVTSGRVTPGRTLEVGSGTATNSIWLAERGFDVLGVDVSPLAVERAHSKMEERGLPVALRHWTFSPRLCPMARSTSSSTAVALMSSMNPRSARASSSAWLPDRPEFLGRSSEPPKCCSRLATPNGRSSRVVSARYRLPDPELLSGRRAIER